jgi:hypothetical protein
MAAWYSKNDRGAMLAGGIITVEGYVIHIGRLLNENVANDNFSFTFGVERNANKPAPQGRRWSAYLKSRPTPFVLPSLQRIFRDRKGAIDTFNDIIYLYFFMYP